MRRAAFIFSSILCLVSGAALTLQSVAGADDRGVVAAVAPPARLMQDQIAEIGASLRGIEKNTRETADNTRETADNTRETADNTSQIAANTAAAKRETSDDPRKELANRGVSWNYRAFCKPFNMAMKKQRSSSSMGE